MYLLGKRLKYKYELKDDVRQSLYDMCDEWVSSFSDNQVFKGGNIPNLADLVKIHFYSKKLSYQIYFL